MGLFFVIVVGAIIWWVASAAKARSHRRRPTATMLAERLSRVAAARTTNEVDGSISFRVTISANSPAQDPSAFPRRPQLPVTPAPHVPCKIYYARYWRLDVDQRAFYIYWRQEYERGHLLPCDATYRYLYSYELARRSRSSEELETRWRQLAEAYATDEGFREHLLRWAADLKLQRHELLDQEELQLLKDDPLELTMTVTANLPPSLRLVLSLYSKERIPLDAPEVAAALKALDILDTSPVLTAAKGCPRAVISRYLFAGLGSEAHGLQRFGTVLYSFDMIKFTPDMHLAIDAIAETALKLMGHPRRAYGYPPPAWVGSSTADPDVDLRDSAPEEDGVSAKREEIMRCAVAALPKVDTLDGATWLVRNIMPNSTRILLLAILWMSAKRPYIEGKIAFSKELRVASDSFATAIGGRMTIGTMRGAFWTLGSGPRAIFELSPAIATASDIRTNVTNARFTKPLQYVFAGSDARNAVIDLLCDRLCATMPGGCTREKLYSAARSAGLLSADEGAFV